MFLAGCGYHGCISQADVYRDIIRSVVYTNPGSGAEGKVSYWTKVDFPVNGKDITLEIDNYYLNFCENARVEAYDLRIPEAASLQPGQEERFDIKFPVRILKGEEITFSLNPVKDFIVDESICRNYDEDVHVTDTDACLKNNMNHKHYIYFSGKLSSKYGFSNSWYQLDGTGTPLIDEYVVPYLMHTGGSGKTVKPSDTRGNTMLCLSRGEIKKKIERDFPPDTSSTRESRYEEDKKEKEKKLADMHAEMRALREGLVDTMDEYSINVNCGKLCGSDGKTGGTTEGDVGKTDCKGWHLLTVGGKNVLPMVRIEGSDLTLKTAPAASQATSTFPNSDSIRGGSNVQNLTEALGQVKSKYDGTSATTSTVKHVAERNPLYLDQAYVFNDASGTESQQEEHKITLVVKNDSKLRIAGGYNIRIKKECSAHIENSLYYTFSSGIPVGLPGSNDTQHKKINFFSTFPIQIKGGDSGDLYIGVKDNGDGYENNLGFFEIRAKVMKTPPKVFSHIASWTEGQVRAALYGRSGSDNAVRKMYEHISTRSTFMATVNAMLVLYVVVSALYFFLGFSRASVFQLAIMISKVVIVMLVLQPGSWEFFNGKLFNLFIGGPKFLIGAMTGGIGSDGDFGFMDGILFRFSVSQTWIQLLAMIFAGPVGWLSVVLIFWGIFVLVQFLFQAVVIYLISMMTIALLLSVAPYFLICVLFKRTKNIFDMWIKTLLQTAVQPVLIFSCIALLINAINEVIYAMLNFEVCDACVYKADLMLTKICVLSFPLPIGVIPMTPINDTIREITNTGETVLLGLPGPVFNILIFLALVHAARDFVLNSGDMCSIMFGAFTNLSDVGGNAAQSILSTFGFDKTTGHMLDQHKLQSSRFHRGSGGGRADSSLIGPMSGFGGTASGSGGGTRRRPIIHPADPPASF
ncbi:type IV secretion system protein [Candidatus Anaplasma sp. TIGMIC]|uniref:type IV secretion system protein n=1 Tax=Candidatus Anaplasma sp. TIGMIC TaxID=3020713 RepID=UPI0023311ABF|nr:type IV secretion system protein [Candidatus Anaplasma sp. TIGMIC]